MTRSIIFAIATVVLAAAAAQAQMYDSSSGSYMTGFGRVNGSFQYAMATQRVYQGMQRRMMERAAARSGGAGASNGSTSSAAAQKPAPPKFYGRFRPDPSVNMAATVSEALFEDAADRAQLRKVIEAVQAEYKKEAAAKGWTNNLAGGLTYFMAAMSTVYHDSPEPSDETLRAIYDAANQEIDSTPDFARATNKDKTIANDMLVAFTAVPLATYIEAKANGDAQSLKVARDLAGELIKLVLKTDPDKLKF